ncbi:hypothetical protein ACU6DI_003963 [Vibrio navarrensis]
MSWITLTSVTATNGQKTVAVNSGSTATIKIGDALKIGAFDIYEIEGVFANQLTLRDAWAHATQTNAKAVVVPTFGDFNAAVTAMRDLTDVAVNNLSVIEDWGTKSGNVTFQGKDGQSYDARTMQQMDADVAELEAQASNLIINVSGRGFARSEADMLAMRAANATKFAASGFVHFGKHYQGLNVNEGLWAPANSPNECFIGRSSSNLAGTSDTDSAVINLAGFMVNLALRADYGRFTVKFPEAPDGTVTYDSATGAVVKHPDAVTAFASETATNKVVTERVDMFGLEMNLQTINDAQPFFAPYGCAQSQSTTVDGIATEVDNINPISYFAAYPGDTTSRGRGWNITKLSDAQKEKLFSNPEHNVFRMNNGELKYAKVVQKTIPGAGNGDWENVNPATGNPLRFDANTPVLSPAGQPYVPSKQWRGVFEDGTGYYFYVLGTVLRLNQGAYHHSFNPLGTTLWRDKTGGNGGGNWNAPFVGSPSSRSDCFFYYALDSSPYTQPGALADHGAIGKLSGHPKGKFYDAIYPDGEGGVIDRRLSAFPITMDDYFKAIAKVENESMRGLQKLIWTFLDLNTDTDNVAGSGFTPTKGLSNYKVGDTGYIQGVDGVFRPYKVKAITSIVQFDTPVSRKGGGIVVHSASTNLSVSGDFLQTDVVCDPTNITQVDALKKGWMGHFIPLINSAANVEMSRKVTGQFITASNSVLYTDNFGVSWSTAASGIDSVTSTRQMDTSNGTRVYIVNYLASAKVTKPSLTKPVYGGRTGLGDVSASSWFGGSNNGIALLAESLLGKILTSNGGWGDLAMSLRVLSSNIRGDNGKVQNINKHEPIPLVAPLNNSPAIKLLPHAVSENGLALLGYIWNELKYGDPEFVSFDSSVSTLFLANKVYRCTAGKHAGRIFQCVSNSTVAIDNYYIDDSGKLVTSTGDIVSALKLWSGNKWGDDGTMLVIDNTGTYNNLNGESCQYGYAVSALPIGWVDNHARFGAQVPGVDL